MKITISDKNYTIGGSDTMGSKDGKPVLYVKHGNTVTKLATFNSTEDMLALFNVFDHMWIAVSDSTGKSIMESNGTKI
jgi:hypothetical protein